MCGVDKVTGIQLPYLQTPYVHIEQVHRLNTHHQYGTSIPHCSVQASTLIIWNCHNLEVRNSTVGTSRV